MNGTAEGVSVVVPCFNEANAISGVLENLAQVLKALPCPWETIVVDDGSTDGSAEKVDTGRFHLVRHETNRGYGASLKTGARHARYNLIALIDADGTYPADRIPELVRQCEDYDMAVGARTGKNARVPPIRRPAKWILNALANYISGHHIPDLNSGLRVVRRSLWEKFERFFPNGFSLTTTITLASLTNGYRVKFLPIDYHYRVGKSKIRPIRDTLNFFILVLRTILYFDPLKVFIPASLLLFLGSLLVGGVTLILSNVFHIGKFMDVSTLVLLVTALQLLAIGVLADLITKRMP